MNSPEVSVIIPTHNRAETLAKCLAALQRQTFPADQFEVIVVDDGSQDSTSIVASEAGAFFGSRFLLLPQEKKGPAAARNLALSRARGSILVILNDDTIATPGLLAAHVELQREPQHAGKVCVFGEMRWSPELELDDFMMAIEDHQFALNGIDEGQTLDYRYFVTCNLSVPRSLLKEVGGFDEDFPYPAFEDIEVGYRLHKAGAKIIYSKAALGYHLHQVSFSSYCRRTYLAGASKRIFFEKHPELEMEKYWEWRRIFRLWGHRVLRKPLLDHPMILDAAAKLGVRIDRRKWYLSVLKYYFEKGFRAGVAQMS